MEFYPDLRAAKAVRVKAHLRKGKPVKAYTRIGFTGTKTGMSAVQQRVFTMRLALLKKQGAIEFHHGDCVGADAQAHEIAKKMGFKIHVHPPLDPKLRAFKKGDVAYPEKSYRARNTDIVNATEIL